MKCPLKLGKYQVVKLIGKGSTSRVYLAEDPFAQRAVAVKVFDQTLLTQAHLRQRLQKMFLNEASLVGQLNHPHIVMIYDAVTEPNQSFLVMEYLAGGTLEPYCLLNRLLPIEQVVEIVFKGTKALEYAYRQGIIHRDIKPANILLTAQSDIKISDFGSALLERNDETQLSAMGSPAYMSPEQLRQESLNQKTDIYALGMVMYQLLTGHYPFSAASNLSLIYQILNKEPIPPSCHRAGVPASVDRIVMKALQKNQQERYRDWDEFGSDLLAIAGGVKTQQEIISDTEKFNLIKQLSFFQDFEEIQIWEVLRITTWKSVPEDTLLMQEGEMGDSFYVLTEGDVSVTRGGMSLTTLKPGDCFGEMLYFSETHTLRTTSVIALTHCVVIEINAATLNVASDACQVHFNKAFLRILDKKLSRLVSLVSGV